MGLLNTNLRNQLVHTYREEPRNRQITLDNTVTKGNVRCGNCLMCAQCLVAKGVTT